MSLDGPRSRVALVLMVKEPHPGTVKTRLCPPLSTREAARLYSCFLTDLARESLPLAGSVDLVVAWADEDRRDRPDPPDAPPEGLARTFADPAFRFLPQEGATLTDRMSSVFGALFALGYRGVVMRNSDSPHLPRSMLLTAVAALARPGVVVIGPDLDGGYTLLGADADPSALLPRTMSTDSVLEQTVRACQGAGREVVLLERFLDVDTPDDLLLLWLELEGRADAGSWATYEELRDHPALATLRAE